MNKLPYEYQRLRAHEVAFLFNVRARTDGPKNLRQIKTKIKKQVFKRYVIILPVLVTASLKYMGSSLRSPMDLVTPYITTELSYNLTQQVTMFTAIDTVFEQKRTL